MPSVQYSFGDSFYYCNGLSGISSLENAIVFGCIDSIACNYDVFANTDDGTCEYATTGYDYAGQMNPEKDSLGYMNQIVM